MLFVRFSGLLKPACFRIFIQKFVHRPVCPHADAGKKHQFSKPDCTKAIIVGGTGSIGMATANQLLCVKASRVALIDTDICKGKQAVMSLNCAFGKERAMFLKADVTNRHEIQDALRKVKCEFQKVDMIINAFGVWDESKWEDQIKVNLLGTLNVNEVAKDIINTPSGFVLNIIGIPGIEVFSPCPVLAASFLGVVGFTQAKGHERNSNISGLRTVALCCGITKTNFSKDVDKKACCVQMGNDLKKYLKETCWQKPDVVGKAVLEVFKYGPSGTIWIVEGSRLFFLKLPDLNVFRALENQFI